MEFYDINNAQIQLAMVMKLRQLQRENPHITYANLESVLVNWVWRKQPLRSLHVAVNDILSLTADQMVQYLSKQAIIEGYHEKLEDFDDLLGGNRNE